MDEEEKKTRYETIETSFQYLEKSLNESGGEVIHVHVSEFDDEEWYQVILKHEPKE